MSGNLFEKVFVISTISISSLFLGAMYFKKPKVQKSDAFKVRQQLLKQPSVKMLYSTMSFFYLQGFKQRQLQSFYNMHKVLSIQKPNFVILPISKEEYDEKYFKYLQHPKFRESMDRFIHNLQTQNSEAIQSMDDFDLSNLEKLYLIDHCHRLKKCKVVYGRKSKEYYKSLKQSIKKMQYIDEGQQLTNKVEAIKIENYTDTMINEMKPKMNFSLVPETPFKIIFGTIEPQLLNGTSAKWKEKFMQSYNHQVIEDQAVLQRQQQFKQVKQKGSVY